MLVALVLVAVVYVVKQVEHKKREMTMQLAADEKAAKRALLFNVSSRQLDGVHVQNDTFHLIP